MYGYPATWPPFSNRETFAFPLRVTDDDTGDQVNISGVIGSGTFASWNVRAGMTLTTSLTSITIPQFPFSNELTALALTVPIGLVINAQDPITITDLSGVNSMQGYVLSYNALTGALVCQIGCTFQFEIRAQGPFSQRGGFNDGGYAPSVGQIGTFNGCAPLITASLGDRKIMFVEPSVIQVRIPETEMFRLYLGTFLLALTINDSYDQKELALAQLPILFGGVTQ